MDFTLNFPTRLTKEYILKYTNQESLMSYYLGLPVTKKLYRNPLRNDRHVTAAFWRNPQTGDLIFNDFATGIGLDFIGVIRSKFHVSYHEALKIAARDLGLISNYSPKKIKPVEEFKCSSKTNIQVEIKPFSQTELNWWLKYGITEDTLKLYNVFSVNTVFINENIYSRNQKMVFGYYFGKRDDIEFWKIYYPLKTNNRFIMNCNKNMLQGIKQLPKEDDLLIITKSLKDVMCFHELGISAIAPNSETMFMTPGVYKKLQTRFKDIVVFFDNDYQGIKSVNKLRKNFAEFDIKLNIIWIPRKYGFKDITDAVKGIGFEKVQYVVQELLKAKKGLQ